MATNTLDCLVGIVGYSPVLDAYPLGQRLMRGLEQRLAPHGCIAVENMSWGPIHIVQHFQDEAGPRPARLILVGAAPVSRRAGAVTALRWAGGRLLETELQERIYEAVTGIVDIDNTLMIGEHFAIWPAEVFAVEADLPVNCFGDMVIADSNGRRSDAELSMALGFSPADVVARLVDTCDELVAGAVDPTRLPVKQAEPLARGQSFARHRIAR
jgi:hypothetical protein